LYPPRHALRLADFIFDALPGRECEADERVSSVVQPQRSHAMRLDLPLESIPSPVYVPLVEWPGDTWKWGQSELSPGLGVCAAEGVRGQAWRRSADKARKRRPSWLGQAFATQAAGLDPRLDAFALCRAGS